LALQSSEVKAVLERVPGLCFGIVGDFCADVYLKIDRSASETSLETGLPTQPVAEQRFSLGGAGNVAANLTSMGAKEVRAFGVVGADLHGDRMIRLLNEQGISTSGLLLQEKNWYTHVFTKILIDDVEQPRLDYGNFNEPHPDIAAQLLHNLEDLLPRLDILIVNQQAYRGIHTTAFRKALAALINRHQPTLCVTDSRTYSDEFAGTIRKININEALRLCGRQSHLDGRIPGEIVRQSAAELFKRWQQPVIVTRGEYGCVVFDQAGVHEIPGLLILGRTDSVGAGDSMLAGIAAALAAGFAPPAAAEFGTLVAGVTVQKLFVTGTATPGEILELCSAPAYRVRPELALRPETARYYPGTRIEIVSELPERREFTHVILDHDGTISTLRQGWEEVMEPMMIQAIVGGHRNTIEGDSFRRIQARVRELIDATTGVQTLVQMKSLSQLVREYGYVAEKDILDERGYKQIYNEALMRRVETRLRRIKEGRLLLSEVTIKNAVAFLEALDSRGIRLYLASGTDQEDVEREAALLGYADLFAGRIYGAVGDIKHEPKSKVIEAILRDIAAEGRDRIVSFGDGPVEIRETRARGSFAVGVASDEVKRSGLNLIKRSRLIQAGADLIISDFEETDLLLKLLFGE
jgi:bifunctional ADP-heptose synthase (sugar kinase/adenylyltransferase)/phosphoglycolate phosphatase-like HAD superfamily hydrolase